MGILEIKPDLTTLTTTMLESARAPATVVVGGSDPNKFVPNINLSRWDDEYFLNANFTDVVIDKELLSVNDGKAEISTSDETVKIYSNPDYPDAVLEAEFVLLKKPLSNKLTISLTHSEGVRFAYQDPTYFEANPDLVNDHDGVSGSYAVLINKRNNEYRAGLFGYIFCWVFKDADGKTERALMHIDPTSKTTSELTISVSQEFINKATYPVTATGIGGSQTFGVTDLGGTGTSILNTIVGTAYLNDQGAGTATAISIGVKGWASGEKMKAAYYDSSENKVGDTEELSAGGANGFYDASINGTPAVLDSTTYDLVAWSDSSCFLGLVITGSADYWGQSEAYGSWSAALDAASGTGREYSIHLDFDLGGGSSVTKDGTLSASGAPSRRFAGARSVAGAL